MDEYISLLKDSLRKKERILIELQDKSDKQAEIVKEENIDWDSFIAVVDEKGVLIEELTKLDDGFGSIYERIKENLQNDKERGGDM